MACKIREKKSDEFEIGAEFLTASRTLTETDVVMFMYQQFKPTASYEIYVLLCKLLNGLRNKMAVKLMTPRIAQSTKARV